MKVNAGSLITVSGLQQWYNAIRAGRAFSRRTSRTAVAAEFAHVQLFNPAASGVTLLVRRITVRVGTTAATYVNLYSVELTTLVGAGYNLQVGAAAGLGVTRTQSNAVQLGNTVRDVYVTTTEDRTVQEDYFCELPANTGILVNHEAQNSLIVACFEWEEVT